MSVLTLLLVRGQDGRRLLLTASCAGVVSVLLLLAVAVLRLPAQAPEQLFALLADPGLRPGLVLALVLMVAPVLLLLYQLLRLGTTARERRLAVLRTVGATPGQVRALSAAELVVPAAVGAAVLGPVGYAVLRLLLGGGTGTGEDPGTGRLGLVPSTVAPTAVEVLLVVLLVAALCGLVGWSVSRDTLRNAYSLTRRAGVRRPRPWPLLVVAASLLVAFPLLENTLVVVVCVALAALGLLLLGPWVASTAGAWAGRRAEDAASLLAAGRAAADPWAGGRAVAPIALVGLVGGGATAIVVQLVVWRQLEPFFVLSLALVGLALLLALVLVVLSLAAHSVETLLEHRRSTASLAAAGAPVDVLSRSLVLEARLLARPAATIGLVVGTIALAALVGPLGEPVLAAAVLASSVLTLGVLLVLIELAGRAAARLVDPWLRAATAPEALRTE